MLRALVKAHVNIDDHDNHFGYTPLMEALRLREFAPERWLNDYAELLIDAGADVNLKSKDTQWTALHLVVKPESFKSVALVKKLRDAGADVTARDYQGRAPIDFLKKSDPPELFELLKLPKH